MPLNEKIIDMPRRVDHRLIAIANAADIAIMHEEAGVYEIELPHITLDKQAIVEISQALSKLKIRQVQTIDILADELLGRDNSSEMAH